MKIRPAGTELFHADGRTDMTKLIASFRNSANVPKTIKENWNKFIVIYYENYYIWIIFSSEVTTFNEKRRNYLFCQYNTLKYV
jgi:hypothetical protein